LPPRGRAEMLSVMTWRRDASILALALAALVGIAAGGRPPPSEDRSTKLDLISRLSSPPQLVVLGSSRSRRAEPSYLTNLTGLTAFNAGVRGGTAADAYVIVRYLADCAPVRNRRYIWFVDAGLATSGIPPELAADPRSRGYLGLAPSKRPACKPLYPPDGRHDPDGSYTAAYARILPEHAANLPAEVARLVKSVRLHHGSLNAVPDPKQYVLFERTLAFMNRHGSEPIIVFNPIEPKVLAALRAVGFPARKLAGDYLRQLHSRYRFVVVDAEDIHRWGGSASDFWEATHIDYANMRRLLRYVVAHVDGALR
jgi:hypothetical protein